MTSAATHEASARARLAGALATSDFELRRCERRWLALAADRIAFAADDDATWRRLGSEGWLLARWRAAGIPAPRVLHDDDARRAQIRERVHGLTGDPVEPRIFGGTPPASRLASSVPLSRFGARLAESYGELASRIRRAVSVEDATAAGFGLATRRDLDLELALARLPPDAVGTATRARAWLADVPPPDAVIHADLHFHNLCLADDGAIVGVFDLDEAGIDAAATELHYVHSLGPRFVATALAAYGTVDVGAVWRAHVRTALAHLIWHGPGAPRHASIVAWVTDVLANLDAPRAW